MTAKVWSGVAIAVQSALSAAQTISSISKASPGVITYVGADPANGDYLLLTVQGMSQVDAKIVRVANVNAGSNTLEMEGVDSTLYDTFSSGTMQVITFGTTLSVVGGLSTSGGDFNFIDVTTIHDSVNKQIPGNANASSFNLTCNWDPADAGLIALKTAADSKAVRCIKITFSDSTKYLFAGYVGATLAPTGSAQQKVETPVVLTVYGRPTAYST
jgi:hypothetical protein